MYFEWDEAKRVINLTKHGIDFARAADFFAGDVLSVRDARRDYGEPRWISLGVIDTHVVIVVWTIRGGDGMRIISMRRANAKERQAYEAAQRTTRDED